MADINVDRLIVQIEARTKQFESQLKKLEGTVKGSNKRMEASFTGMSSKIAAAGKTLLASFGVGVGIGTLAQLPGMLMNAADAIGSLGEQAQSAGVKVKDLIELTRAGLGSGLNQEAMVKTLGTLTDRLGEARLKGNDLKKIFDANNVALLDTAGNVRSTAEMLEQVATLVANARNEQDKMVIATAAFGDRLGRQVLPLLNEGGEGIRKMREEARHLSDFITDDMVKAADEFGDSWTTAWHDFTIISQAAIFKASAGLKGLLQQAVEFRQGLLDSIQNNWRSWLGMGDENSSSFTGGGGGWGGGPPPPSMTVPGGIGSVVSGVAGRLGTTQLPLLGSSGASKSTVGSSSSSVSRQAQKIAQDYSHAAGAIKTAADDVIKSQEAMRKSMMDLGEMGVDALTSIAIRGEKAADVFRNLAMSMAEAAVQAALLGQGPLAGLFGNSSNGGILGSFLGGSKAAPAGAAAAGAAGGALTTRM